MRAANKSEKGSPLLPFALLDLPLPWQLLSLLSRSRFPGKSPARKARPSSRQIPIWISPYERLRARLVLRPADGLFFVSGGRQCSPCCGSGSGPGCLLLLFLLAGVLQLQLLARHLRKSAFVKQKKDLLGTKSPPLRPWPLPVRKATPTPKRPSGSPRGPRPPLPAGAPAVAPPPAAKPRLSQASPSSKGADGLLKMHLVHGYRPVKSKKT